MINQPYRPKVSVITVVFNGVNFLEETIRSVADQSYEDVEYIIIDGGSSDGTVDIIHKYESFVDHWISEPDLGIYDAMNKGILCAKGAWINFMNAGDKFISKNILAEVFHGFEYRENILVGHVEIRYPEYSRTQYVGRPKHLWRGMQFCHQSVFVKSDFHRAHLFNTSNFLAADLEFFYASFMSGIEFGFIDRVVASVVTGGISESNRDKTIDSWEDAITVRSPTLIVKLYYRFLRISNTLRAWIKVLLPKRIIKFLILRSK